MEPARIRHESPTLLNVLEAIGCGGLILDNVGRVLQTNERARRYLGSELNIERCGFRFKRGSSDGAILELLRAALRASSEVDPQLGDYIVVPRSAGRPLILRSIHVAGLPETEGGGTTALIVLEMEDCPQPDQRLLSDVFLLTPAEVRLARRLSRGDNLREVGEELGITVGPSRVQLKTLFLKAGTPARGARGAARPSDTPKLRNGRGL